MSEPKLREWKTVSQAVKITSLSRSMLYKLMNAGRLGYSAVGRTRRIPLDELVRLMEGSMVPATQGVAR